MNPIDNQVSRDTQADLDRIPNHFAELARRYDEMTKADKPPMSAAEPGPTDVAALVERLHMHADNKIKQAMHFQNAAAALSALSAQVAGLKEDAERLDWLIDSVLYIHMRYGQRELQTLDRDGIDTARKAKP